MDGTKAKWNWQFKGMVWGAVLGSVLGTGMPCNAQEQGISGVWRSLLKAAS